NMAYNSLIQTLDKYGKGELIIVWNNGLKVIGKSDTLFETDNGLEDDDTNYVEYHAVAFHVIDMLARPANQESSIYDWLMQRKSPLNEISLYEDIPSKIALTNRQILWENNYKTENV